MEKALSNIFTNSEFGSLEVIEKDGAFLFPATDCARMLGYANPQKAVRDHCKGVSKTFTPSNGGVQTKNYINEGDLYRLIVHSKLEGAQRFEEWIFDDVLPTIRRTGGYVANDDMFIETYLPFAEPQTKALFAAQLAAIKEANAKLAVAQKKIEEDAPKVQFADAVSEADGNIQIGALAKLLKQNGIDIGRTRLFDWLRENKYLCVSGDNRNQPTQSAMEMGLFRLKESTYFDQYMNQRISFVTMVTPKGRQYFIRKILEGAR